MKENAYLFKKLTSKATPKTTEVVSTEANWLGSGRYGDVQRSTLAVEKNGNTREIQLALKQYKDRKDVNAEFLSKLQAVHARSRELGLPVLNTFRIDTDRMTVATTDWSENQMYDVGGYGNKHESEGTKPITQIKNISELATDLFTTAIKAGKENIEIAGDAYFFRFPRTGGEVNVEFVIGDIDGIIDPPVSSENVEELAYYNVESAQYALYWWTRNHVADSKLQEEYTTKIQEIFTTTTRELKVPE